MLDPGDLSGNFCKTKTKMHLIVFLRISKQGHNELEGDSK